MGRLAVIQVASITYPTHARGVEELEDIMKNKRAEVVMSDIDFSSIGKVVEAVINRFDVNTIPPITDPLGASWKQPKVEDIAICDELAVMNLEDFNLLKDYSCSQPTGVYHGKMWKSCVEQFGNKKGIEYYKKHGKLPVDKTLWPWKLVWFAYDRGGDTKYLSNNYRKIVII